jgi:nickel transport protein
MVQRHRARALAIGLLLFSPGLARAHGIQSTVTHVHGSPDRLLLSSAFSSGVPTSNASVRLVAPAGGPTLDLGRTDRQGQLAFALPRGANGDWELQVDGGPGHRDYLAMPVQRGQAQLDQISEHDHASLESGWLAGIGGLGAAAMLLGLQRIRRPD